MILVKVQNSKYKPRLFNFNGTNSKTCFLVLFLCFLSFPKSAECAISEISEIFIEAKGNNKYEAKIKSHERGMTRAFFLKPKKSKFRIFDWRLKTSKIIKNKEFLKYLVSFHIWRQI